MPIVIDQNTVMPTCQKCKKRPAVESIKGVWYCELCLTQLEKELSLNGLKQRFRNTISSPNPASQDSKSDECQYGE